jgi:hypothetical protein
MTSLMRLFCLLGYHRYRFAYRRHLTWHHYTRYDKCATCGAFRTRGERL